jgi:hypothetical protein
VDPKTNRPFPTSSWGDWQGLLFGGLFGALIGALIVGVLAGKPYPLIDSGLSSNHSVQQPREAKKTLKGWDVLAIPVLILIVLGTHEIGHLLAGLSQGMRFLLLIVGPFGWHASVSGTRFEWNTNLALMGGVAATLPTKVGSSLRRQFLFMIAGGPVASLLLAMVAMALASGAAPRAAVYCTFVAVTSFGIFLVTLIPIRAGGFMSDGLRIIDELRGGSAASEQSALLQIFAQSLDGVRPRDWDAVAIEELSRIDSESPLWRTGGSLVLLARAMDCRNDADIARYRAVLEESVNEYPAGFRQSIFVELAICAWLAGDAVAARGHLMATQGGIVEKSRRLLAQAALAKLEGRDQDCERDRVLAIEALAKASDAGQRKLTEDQLALLQGRP